MQIECCPHISVTFQLYRFCCLPSQIAQSIDKKDRSHFVAAILFQCPKARDLSDSIVESENISAQGFLKNSKSSEKAPEISIKCIPCFYEFKKDLGGLFTDNRTLSFGLGMVSAAALLFGDAARKKPGNVLEELVVHADLPFRHTRGRTGRSCHSGAQKSLLLLCLSVAAANSGIFSWMCIICLLCSGSSTCQNQGLPSTRIRHRQVTRSVSLFAGKKRTTFLK